MPKKANGGTISNSSTPCSRRLCLVTKSNMRVGRVGAWSSQTKKANRGSPPGVFGGVVLPPRKYVVCGEIPWLPNCNPHSVDHAIATHPMIANRNHGSATCCQGG